MALCPGVRFILKSSGAVILEAPGYLSLPRKGDDVELTVGGVLTTYKVSAIIHQLMATEHLNSNGGVTRISVSGKTVVELQ